jgi:hypothetical protein
MGGSSRFCDGNSRDNALGWDEMPGRTRREMTELTGMSEMEADYQSRRINVPEGVGCTLAHPAGR